MVDRHGPAAFIADAPGLDFLNSIATPLNDVVDWLEDGDGLLRWLDQAKLVPAEVLHELKAKAMPGELDRVADQARNLREWFRSFVRENTGRPLMGDALQKLAPLNTLLERDEAFSELIHNDASNGSALELRLTRRWRSPELLLQPIGDILARLITQEDFAHVKACEGENCTLVFADHTRSRNRRWCDMAVCGNRAKQNAHRSRLRLQH